MRQANITARSRRLPRSTTGGTGTPHTWMLASVGLWRRRPPLRPRDTWRTSSTLSSRLPEHRKGDHASSVRVYVLITVGHQKVALQGHPVESQALVEQIPLESSEIRA